MVGGDALAEHDSAVKAMMARPLNDKTKDPPRWNRSFAQR